MRDGIMIGVICAVFGALISHFFQSQSDRNANQKMLEDTDKMLDKYSERLTIQFTALLTHHVEVYHQDRTSELITNALDKYNMAVDYKLGVRDKEIKSIKEELSEKSKQLSKIQIGIVELISKCNSHKDTPVEWKESL